VICLWRSFVNQFFQDEEKKSKIPLDIFLKRENGHWFGVKAVEVSAKDK
jgi:hypothetical protein